MKNLIIANHNNCKGNKFGLCNAIVLASKSTIAVCCFLLFSAIVTAQHTKTNISFSKSIDSLPAKPSNFHRSEIRQKNSPKTVEPFQIVKTGRANKKPKKDHSYSIADSIWADKALKKRNALKIDSTLLKTSVIDSLGQSNENGSNSAMPAIGIAFDAQVTDCGTPSDNAMAISNGGTIVNADNCTIRFYNSVGALLDEFTYPDFFGVNEDGYFDPKLLYDSEKDRFIFTICQGGTPSTSNIKVCFSSSNNPMNAWYVYEFNDFTNNGFWFDYPSVGVSNNEFYVTGNLFSINPTNGMFQIDKHQGFLGQPINYLYWEGAFIQPGSVGNYNAFTLVPISYGQQGHYGPGIYFVATEFDYQYFSLLINQDYVYLYDLTQDLYNNPQIDRYDVFVGDFDTPGPAFMPNSDEVFIKNDTRVLSGFYLPPKIHFVHSKDIGGGFSGVQYHRLDLSTGGIQSETSFLSNSDYAYPSIASFGANAQDHSAVICFLRSDISTFPEIRFKYFDNDMIQQPSELVKAGESYIDYGNHPGLPHGQERWGDYTGIQRKFNSSPPSVWLSGSYSKNNAGLNFWQTYVAEIKDGCLPPAQPSISASGTTALCPGQSVTLSINNLCNGCSATWSNGQQGPSITVSQPGNYTAQVTNGCGSSGASNSVAVTTGTAPTTPNISASGTTALCPGQSVTLSINNLCNGCSASWSNGQQGQSITVSQPGNYTAQMANGCGSSGVSNSVAVTTGTAPTTPSISASGTTALCPGQSVTLSINNLCNGCSASWSNGQQGQSITVSQPGNYTAQMANGCGSSGVSNSVAVTTGTAPTTPSISASGTTALCPGQSVTLSINNLCNGCSASWSNGQQGQSITVSQPGNYTAQVTNGCGSSGMSNSISVQVVPYVPTFSVNNQCYFAAPAGSNYQWYLNGLPIAGATGQFYVAMQVGYYTLSMTNPDNCIGTSQPFFASCAVGTEEQLSNGQILVYPNPVSTHINLEITLTTEADYSVDVCSMDGRIIQRNLNCQKIGNSIKADFDTARLSQGFYYFIIYEPGSPAVFSKQFEVIRK